MLVQRNNRKVVQRVATLSLLFYLAVPVFGQAWLPLKGDGSISTTYSNMYVRNHVNFEGTPASDGGRIRTNVVLMGFEYGLTDKFALSADLAYIASKWIKGPKPPHGPNDTGFYHPTLQDAHLELRYNASSKTLVVTPFIGVIVPTHDYETRGHSAVGRGFHQLLLGVNVGRQLDRVLRDSYVHARYSYAILAPYEDLSLNRSNADCEVGWSATRKLSLRFISSFQNTHGGIVTSDPNLDAHEREFHDRISRSHYIYLGGGVGLSLTRSFGIYADYLTTAYARSGHAPGGFLLGVSWSFSKGLDLSHAKISPIQPFVQATH